MRVVARFYVSQITKQAYAKGSTQVALQAVSRGEHNKNWAHYTPAGQITMTINNESPAAQAFEDALGKEVGIEFDLDVDQPES